MAGSESPSNLKVVRNIIIRNLKAAGFTIHLDESYTTNSSYIKLDYGLMNSIRISDHEGKSHLAFRYNVLTTMKGMERRMSSRGERFFYSINNVADLITRLIMARKAKVHQMGVRRYKAEMASARIAHRKDAKGFWSRARKV